MEKKQPEDELNYGTKTAIPYDYARARIYQRPPGRGTGFGDEDLKLFGKQCHMYDDRLPAREMSTGCP